MRVFWFTAFILLMILLNSCGDFSKNRPFYTHFWTSSSWGEQLFLMVDDTIKGPLPYLPQPPSCGAPDLEKATLSVALSSGSHEVVVQNKDGKVYFAEILKLKNSKNDVTISSSTNFHETASKRTHVGDCLIEEIYKK